MNDQIYYFETVFILYICLCMCNETVIWHFPYTAESSQMAKSYKKTLLLFIWTGRLYMLNQFKQQYMN